MRQRPKRGTLLLLACAVVVSTAGLVTGVGADDAPTPLPGPSHQEIAEAIRTGKAKRLPPSAADISFGGHWQGCRFVIQRSLATRYQMDSSEIRVVGDPSQNPTAGTTPSRTPPEPNCVPRSPTPAEIAAFEAEIDKLNAGNRPPGAPEPPKRPPRKGLGP